MTRLESDPLQEVPLPAHKYGSHPLKCILCEITCSVSGVCLQSASAAIIHLSIRLPTPLNSCPLGTNVLHCFV